MRNLLSPRMLLTTWPSQWLGGALAASFWPCVEVQRNVLRSDHANFDVLIGSSWGGAVAAALLAEGAWTGPTLLMCPALNKLSRHGGDDSITQPIVQGLKALPDSQKAQCLLIHGDADETVPLDDSRRLADETGIELVVIPGGSHGMSAVARDGRLLRFAERVVQASQNYTSRL